MGEPRATLLSTQVLPNVMDMGVIVYVPWLLPRLMEAHAFLSRSPDAEIEDRNKISPVEIASARAGSEAV